MGYICEYINAFYACFTNVALVHCIFRRGALPKLRSQIQALASGRHEMNNRSTVSELIFVPNVIV